MKKLLIVIIAIFLVFIVNSSTVFALSSVSIDKAPYPPSPLTQFKSGIGAKDVKCILGFELILKTENDSPACVELETAQKFVDRGWAKIIIPNVLNSGTIVTIPVNSSISTSGLTFSPSTVQVVIGVNNTVEWINMDSVMNDVTSDAGSFETSLVPHGHAWEHIFDKTGTYQYHSAIHPWLKGTVIVLPQSSNFMPFASKTYNLKQVHYYDSSNLNPKVSLYDSSYGGIDKDGLVSIGNQTFYQTTLDNDIYKLKGKSIQFHNVTFSFPEGTLITPGGAFVNLDVKFQDGFEEIYGGTMSNPDGSGGEGGIPIPTQYGPHLATNSITILGNHTMPQAGLTIYHDKVKLLVSNDPQTSPTVPQCVSNIQNQYAIAGFRDDPLCPVVNFQASGKIVNYTGFYGVYGYSTYPGTSNFVLEPGHNGTIAYRIDIGSIYNWGNEPPANHVNITNDIEFIHDAGMRDHPGVTAVMDSKSEIIQKNSSAFVTITFAATTDARPGTYWIHLPPGLCSGGDIIILTITNCEK